MPDIDPAASSPVPLWREVDDLRAEIDRLARALGASEAKVALIRQLIKPWSYRAQRKIREILGDWNPDAHLPRGHLALDVQPEQETGR